MLLLCWTKINFERNAEPSICKNDILDIKKWRDPVHPGIPENNLGHYENSVTMFRHSGKAFFYEQCR